MRPCGVAGDGRGTGLDAVTVRRLVAAAGVVLASAVTTTSADAIPLFARIYDKPCATCHTVFPQLNPAGEDFRAHGFHGLPPVVKPLRAGPVDVPGTIPLALYLTTGEDVTHTEPHATRSDFNLDYLSLLSGGELGEHLAFLVDYELVETEPETGKIDVNSLPEQAYLQAHAEPLGWLANLRLGWFELPLGVSPRVHRLSAQPYLTYELRACDLLGRAPAGVRCDNVAVVGESQIGAELGARDLASGFGWAVGVANGSNNRLDATASRQFYVRLAEQIGLHKAGLFLLYAPDLYGRGDDRTLRVGPDLDWYSRRARVLAQFLANHESNPTDSDVGLWYYGTFVEGEYRLTTRLLALARGEYTWAPRFDDTHDGGDIRVRRQTWAVTGGAQWLLFENLKLVAEGTYGENRESVGDVTTPEWSVALRLVTAFWVPSPPATSRVWPFRQP